MASPPLASPSNSNALEEETHQDPNFLNPNPDSVQGDDQHHIQNPSPTPNPVSPQKLVGHEEPNQSESQNLQDPEPIRSLDYEGHDDAHHRFHPLNQTLDSVPDPEKHSDSHPQNMRNPSLMIQDLDGEAPHQEQEQEQQQPPEKTLIAESSKPQDLVTIPDESDLDQTQRPQGDRDLQSREDAVAEEHDQPCEDPNEEGTRVSIQTQILPSEKSGVSSGRRRSSSSSSSSFKRKKEAKRRAMDKKLKLLNPAFKPISFVPHKTLDFSKHEKVLKRLGLWDFVHLEFDRNIRADLLSQIVVNYAQGYSFVNYRRVAMSRASLARALKLPKKDKVVVAAEEDTEEWSGESLAFIEDFTLNWVLLHGDTWMMPSEVLASTRLIKEGHPEKVDWASLMWFMVDKELLQGTQLGNCYYASHLQCVLKSQKKNWFEEQPEESVPSKEESYSGKMDVVMEVEEDDEEEEGATGKAGPAMKEGDEVGDGGDTRMTNLGDLPGNDLEEQNLQLTLGQENVEKRDGEEMDFEESKEEEPGQWFLNGNCNGGDMYLQRCSNIADFKGLDSDIGRKEVEVDEEGGGEEEEGEGEGDQEGRFNLDSKCNAHEELSLENLIPAMEEHIPFTSMYQLQNSSSGELLASRAAPCTLSTGQSMFSNAGKRVLDHGDNISLHFLDANPKRLKINGPRDDRTEDFEIESFIEEIARKFRTLHHAKERACAESSYNQQALLNNVQHLNGIIQQLDSAKYEEVQKKEMEILRLQRELCSMGNLLQDYRKALKESHKEFAEYRRRCPALDEPRYKDVPGSRGLVLSTAEIEKQRQQQEMEERSKCCMIEQRFMEFEQDWITKLEEYSDVLSDLNIKTEHCANDMAVLKQLLMKRKESNLPARVPEE